MADAVGSSAAPSATAAGQSVQCGAQLYNTPTQDSNCAIPYDSSDNATDIMSSCCNSAPVISYYDNCGLYCLALDQSVEDLTSCLMQAGAQPQDVFCRGNVTATATGSGGSVPTSAQASVVAGATGASGGSGSSSSGSSGGSGGSSGSSDDGLDGVDSEDDSSGNGANIIRGGLGLGKIAVVILGMLAVPFWIG